MKRLKYEKNAILEVLNTYPGTNAEGIFQYIDKNMYLGVDRKDVMDAIGELEKEGKIKYDVKVHGYYLIINLDLDDII